jgi:predicted nucleic acid-binding protein
MNALIDTSVLVAAMVEAEAHHAACRVLVVAGDCGMYAHGLAEVFSTSTGGTMGFRLYPAMVAGLLEDHFAPKLTLITLSPGETLRAMRETEARGVRGGAVFDYLHLVAARKAKAARLYTLNVSTFRSFHRPGDPEIVHP